MKCEASDAARGSNHTEHVLTWTSDALQVRCVAVEYNDYPAVEWTVYLKNIGTASTPILEGIQGLDTRMSREPGSEFILHCNKGDSCTADSYEPYQVTLPSSEHDFTPSFP